MAPADVHEEILRCIETAPIFQGITEKGFHLLLQYFARRKVEKGNVVFSEGDPAEALYLVLKGSIVEHVTGLNDAEIVVKERLPGDYFGEMGMLLNEPQFVTAIARYPTSLAILPKKEFLSLVKTEPTLSLFLLRTLAHRLRLSAQIGISYACFDAPSRLAYLILTLESEQGRFGSVVHSQEELGQRCGLARQTVSRILGEWRQAGWLKTGRNRIEAIDREALRHILGLSRKETER
jgi:CRP/FNR family transcriptional regulator, cyclic AMP receptor protein